MTKKQFENALKQQAYAAVPDKLSDLLKTVSVENDRGVSLSDNGNEPHLVPAVPAKSLQAAGRWIALAACFAVVLAAVVVAATANRQKPIMRGGTGDDGTTAAMTVPANGGVRETSVTAQHRGIDETVTTENDTQKTTASEQTKGAKGPLTTVRTARAVDATTETTVKTTKKTTAANATQKEDETEAPTVKSTKNGDETEAPTEAPTVKPTKKGEKTEAPTEPTEAPTVVPTTAPTTIPTCCHDIAYLVPVSADGTESPRASSCVVYCETEPMDIEPTTTEADSKGSFTYTVEYQHIGTSPNWPGYENMYIVNTTVWFSDGWSVAFLSVCAGETVLFTDACVMTDKGVAVVELNYDRHTETLERVRRTADGVEVCREDQKVPLGSELFKEMNWFVLYW